LNLFSYSEKLVYISSLLKGQVEPGSENLIIQSRRDIDFCIQSLEDENPEVRAIAAEALRILDKRN